MKQLSVNLMQLAHPVLIGKNLIESPVFNNYIPGNQVCIISDESVAALYLLPLRATLAINHQVDVLVVPDGESSKTLDTFAQIINFLSDHNHHRDTCLIALGGGVIGDLTGFVAACYLRGVAHLQVPTSLLAQVDAAIGGKTAVNLAGEKNRVGAFHQPRAVIIDIATLSTLPTREYCAAFAEIIKYGLICDRLFFEYLQNNSAGLLRREEKCLEYVIERCCQIKAEIVAQDERDHGVRALLNFGHTFGHAIESLSHYAVLHGEAVAIGMVMAASMSCEAGLLDKDDLAKIIDLLTIFSLPTTTDISQERLLKATEKDKKIKRGKQRFVLLTRIGKAILQEEDHYV